MSQNDDWRDNNPDKETSDRWRKDTNIWIWGQFYCNQDDQRLFVSKKIEWMGTT